MFQSHTPVVRDAFHDREPELARLLALVRGLAERSTVSWLAILGQRKVGKTSLLLEMRRRAERSAAFVMVDMQERAPVDVEVFRTYALRCLDAVASSETGRSLEALAGRDGYRGALARSEVVRALAPDQQDFVFDLPTVKLDQEAIRRCLDLAEALAVASGRPMISVWDEFQDLAGASGRLGLDAPATLRSAWQRHARVAYVVSGSEPTMLRELCTSRTSPFFQHFDLMELGPMSDADAVGLVVGASEGGLGEALARDLVRTVGGHPFYLQVLGEELIRAGAPYDEAAVKDVLQRTLFSRTGRLGLYFERMFGDLVGRSASCAGVLAALAASADGLRPTELAHAIGAPSGDTARYVERLGDAIERDPDGRRRLRDRAFAHWIAWREPAGTVVPMALVGDEGERIAASSLAMMGFDLVYQSRASRGAFDLLATRGAQQLGVQVRRRRLPLSFTLPEWRRMEAEAKRMGWSWVVAGIPGAEAVFLDPERVRIGRTARIGVEATIPNLLAWLDERPG